MSGATIPANPYPGSFPNATAPDAPASAIDPSSAQSTAATMIATASSFLDQLKTAGYFTPSAVIPKFPSIGTAPKPVTDDMPALTNVTWVSPRAPAAFSGTTPDISKYLPSPFTKTAPTLSFGTAPTPDYGDAPAAPAVDLNFTLPTLDLNLPAAPSLLSISVAPFGGVTLPTLDATVPDLRVSPPNILSYSEGAIYASTLLSSLTADLTDAIRTGKGLVVGGNVENAIWDRGREREYRQQADNFAELDRMEELGYAFPPGVWLDARLKIKTETDNAIAGVSREIMIKQAENMLENLKQARQIAEELEAKQIDYANQVAQRAFETCKFMAEAAIQVYNGQIEAFKAQLDGYRTKAAIYETQMKGAQLKVDIYKAQLDAEKTKAEVNTALVSQYEAQIRAQSLFVDIYKAELGAIETQANLQKIIVEAYGEEIKAFVGKVNAFTAEVDAYKAQLQSQEVVMGIFKTEVEAYAATAQAGAQQASAVIEGYKADISGYTAKLDAYRADINAMSEQVRGASMFNSAVADVYRSEMSALASYNQVLTEQWRAAAEIAEREAEVAIKAAEVNVQSALSAKNIVIEALKGGATTSAQIGAAALNAIHWSQSSSWSSNISQSLAASWSNAASASNSYSESKSV